MLVQTFFHLVSSAQFVLDQQELVVVVIHHLLNLKVNYRLFNFLEFDVFRFRGFVIGLNIYEMNLNQKRIKRVFWGFTFIFITLLSWSKIYSWRHWIKSLLFLKYSWGSPLFSIIWIFFLISSNLQSLFLFNNYRSFSDT